MAGAIVPHAPLLLPELESPEVAGSAARIRAEQASVVTHDFRIVVELGAHRITAYQGRDVLLSEPIGVGTRDAPTPGGLYYIKELFQPLAQGAGANERDGAAAEPGAWPAD